MTMNHKGFTIKSRFTGSKKASWAGAENWNHHVISVTFNGRRTQFDFWASVAEPEIRTKSDLLNAFECFVSDAIAGNGSFEDFCSDMGYDTDSRKAERTWKACRLSAAKLNRIYTDDLYDLSNSLNEPVLKERK